MAVDVTASTTIAALLPFLLLKEMQGREARQHHHPKPNSTDLMLWARPCAKASLYYRI